MSDDGLRFWSKVDKNGPVPAARPDLGPCWIWTASRNRRWGYGQFSALVGNERKNRRAHIVAYEFLVGGVPEGLVLDHLCRVRHCVNPGHLEAVTQAINCQRGDTGKAPGTTGARNLAKTHCPKGHPYAGDNLAERSGRRYCRACERARWAAPISSSDYELAFTINGAPRTKKNSSRLIWIGKPGKKIPRFIPSAAHERWYKQVKPELERIVERESWEASSCPVHVRALFYREANQGDLVGYMQALADLLEHAGVVENDRLIVSWDGTRLDKDAETPRIECIVRELVEIKIEVQGQEQLELGVEAAD